MTRLKKLSPKRTADECFEFLSTETIAEIVNRLTDNILDQERLLGKIKNQKRVIDMRKDPDHESWMELR